MLLHIDLLKLWEAIEAAGDEIDGKPLGEHLASSFIDDFALTQKGAPADPLRRLGNLLAVLSVWLFGPVVIVLFWWQSALAHSIIITVSIGIALAICMHVGTVSWNHLKSLVSEPDMPLGMATIWYAVIGGFLLLGAVNDRFALRNAHIADVQLVELPDDWRDFQTARQTFRETWCDREELTQQVCFYPPTIDRVPPAALQADRQAWCAKSDRSDCQSRFADLDRQFVSDWDVERKAQLRALPKLDLQGADLGRAFAIGTSLVGANLMGARLKGADFSYSDLESAKLAGANLEGVGLVPSHLENAHLARASLEGAHLNDAWLEGANLEEANLAGADLGGAELGGANLLGSDFHGARLEGANLGETSIVGADLTRTDLRSAKWAGASLHSSLVHFSDLRGAQDLTQAQLTGLIGNSETLLPDTPAPDTGEPYYVQECWATPPDQFEYLQGRIKQIYPEETLENVRERTLCSETEAPQKTGTPCALTLTPEQCLDPAQNPLARR